MYDSNTLSDGWTQGFDAAKEGSRLAQAPRHSRKVGAALYAGRRLLSIGFNSYGQSHPRNPKGYSIHAEHRALLRRQHYAPHNRLIMYIWRETADGNPAHSEPCKRCKELM